MKPTKQAGNENHRHSCPHLRGKPGRLRDTQDAVFDTQQPGSTWPPAFLLIKTPSLYPPSCKQHRRTQSMTLPSQPTASRQHPLSSSRACTVNTHTHTHGRTYACTHTRSTRQTHWTCAPLTRPPPRTPAATLARL